MEIAVSGQTTTLARCASELEQVCAELDANDGEITSEMIARFDDAKLGLEVKVDGWIKYLEMIKVMAGAAKERKERSAKAQKTLENLERRLKEYVKSLIEATPGVPFKSPAGTLAVQRNPEAVKYTFDFPDKTFYRTVDAALVDMEPSLNAFVKSFQVLVIDGEKVKEALKSGVDLPWATLDRGSHLRIRG